ncbi:HORMA domain-containing protein [Cantharellus anzutake]|uniref:HORMA domain-containing protein n=1 Tax=Cantharellus anzutake TaxID=1750568 RepID=UPI001908B0F3|nr:HORMA domain-containing protein [Cantharellus anzutake]KAF8330034.1 HORMA domain-containing protein [Cantharellus anzutake]
MQAQSVAQDQKVVTAAQSLAAVKTLVTAGFGCMTFLRGLLPDENFEDARLSSTGTSLDGDPEPSAQRNVSGVRIKTVKRGYTSEGDQMLDYLEKGVFDALEKQYLQSFVFAIYLDKNDPSNIVEAWTFNFRYHKIEGTNVTVPVFSLDKAMAGISLAGNSDPVMSASLKGRHITLGEVKRSVKNLIRGLITASQGLEVLPLRRHATFKIYYNNGTPQNYEPPFFVPADPASSSFVFTTHNPSESPDKIRLGTLDTPYHSVTLDIASIVSLIPNSEDNTAQFSGLSPGHSPPATFADGSRMRQRAAEVQIEDARHRHIVWDADAPARPKSPPDEGSVRALDSDVEADEDRDAPLGVRGSDGSIQPLSTAITVKKSRRNDEREFNFSSQTSDKIVLSPRRDGTPTEINASQAGSLVTSPIPETVKAGNPLLQKETNLSDITNGVDTQYLKQVMKKGKHRGRGLELNRATASEGSDPTFTHDSIASDLLRANPFEATRCIEEDPIFSSAESELTELSSQDAGGEDEIIEDPGTPRARALALNVSDSQITIEDSQMETPVSNRGTTQVQSGVDPSGLTADCDCGSKTSEVDWILCDSCGRWLHIWCMGYHNDRDQRISNCFRCFPCELREDPNSSLLDENQVDATISSWKALALFRRCLQAVRESGETRPETSLALKKRLGVNAQVAGQVWKRLETEGFICSLQDLEDLLDRLGASPPKARPKSKRGRPTIKRVPVLTKDVNAAFERYFDPRGELEMKAIGLDTLRGKLRDRKRPAQAASKMTSNTTHGSKDGDSHLSDDENNQDADMGSPTQSQTHPGDHMELHASQGIKRKSKESDSAGELPVCDVSNESILERDRKRLKVSMATHALDLEEY